MALRSILSAGSPGAHTVAGAQILLLKSHNVGQETTLPRMYSKQALSHYEVLGLTPKANQGQIKAAYYKLSKLYHPDVNESVGAKAKFAVISEAYEILGNKANRRDYDRSSGETGFSGFTGGTPNVEYEEFLRKQGSFKEKGNIPTGRTKIYDFDEFYRVHYGETLRQKQASNEAKIKYDIEVKERASTFKRNFLLYSIAMTLFGYMILRRL